MDLVTYLVIIGVFSFIAFYSYYLDYSRNRKGEWRIPYKSLIMMSFLFGSIGGVLSIYILGYKEKKNILLNYLALFIHILIGILIYIYLG